MDSLPAFWAELKRRRVVRVAVVYMVTAAGVGGAADAFLPGLGAPDWILRVVLALLVLGLPVAVGLAWAFDVTPKGVQRADPEGLRGADTGVKAPAKPARSAVSFDQSRLAVLPFENLSVEPDNEFFAMGLIDDLVVHLAQIDSLQIAARPSLNASALRDLEIGEIARSFEVGSVLRGSVRRAGGRVRVVAHLIDAGSNEHLWSETYDRELEDIFAVQSDIARQIAGVLGAQLGSDEVAYLDRIPTRNMEAYDLFLRARQDLWQEGAADIARGTARLERAIELDPSFAAAHAAIGLAHVIAPYFTGAPGRVAFPEGRRAAECALAIDERQSLAWIVEAVVKYLYDWDWPGAERDLDTARELDPDVPEQHLFRGHYYGLMRRFAESLAVYEAVRGVDQLGLQRMHALILVLAGRPAEALPILDELLRTHPTVFEHHGVLAAAHSSLGRHDEAAASYATAARLADDYPFYLAMQAVELQKAGRSPDAESVKSQTRDALTSIPSHEARAVLAIADSNLNLAAAEAEAAAEARSPVVLWLRSYPGCEPLRDHPRFVDLVHRIWPQETG